MQDEILIVDDNPSNLKLLAAILTENGFQVKASISGSYALKSIKNGPPDLILLDVKMPKMDGYEVCRQLKSDSLTINIPVIFISGLSDETSKVKGFEAGGVDYITKPFQSQEILARVKTHLSLNRMKHQLEKMVQEQTIRLEETKRHFQQLFELASDAFFILDSKGKIFDINHQACISLGYSRKEFLQLNVSDIETGLSPKQILDLIDRSDQGQKVISRGIHQCKDGSTFPVEVNLGLFQEQNPRLYLIIVRDITERIQAEEKEREHERQLFQAAKMVSLGTLVAGVAHEINNPNNYIKLNVQNLQEFWIDIKKELDSLAQKNENFSLRGINYKSAENMIDGLLSGIEKGSDRIEKSLNALKNYARKDDAIMDQELDISKVIHSSLQIMDNEIKKSTNHFKLIPTSDRLIVKGNYYQIEQIIINLITNACQSLESKDCAIEISSEYDLQDKMIKIKISDEGIGIPQENLSQIMDPFFTTKRKIGGTGLGLSISFRIVKNHGGDLTFHSRENKGTDVILSLPQSKNSCKEN